MELSEFELQPRGPYLFDHYIHPVMIPSPLGSFSLEFHVDNASRRPPGEKMLAAIVALRDAFQADMDQLVLLVHEEYLLAIDDEEWCEEIELPTGLRPEELEPLLSNQSMTISNFGEEEAVPDPGRVYMSPEWDEEHGLYFARLQGKWEKVDC